MRENDVSAGDFAAMLHVHVESVALWVGDIEDPPYNKHAASFRLTGGAVEYVAKSKAPGYRPGEKPDSRIVGPHMVSGEVEGDTVRLPCARESQCLSEYVRRSFHGRDWRRSACCPAGCRYVEPVDAEAERAERLGRRLVVW
jgi:hypothetical protein